jgi:hypothetical protein
MGLLLVSLVSLVVAVVMCVVAWRLLRDERLRSQARVAALAAEIHGEDSNAADRFSNAGYSFSHDEIGEVTHESAPLPAQSAAMFAATPERTRLPLVAAVTALVLAAALGASFLFGASGEEAVPAKSAMAIATTRPHTPPSATPLQLVALGHERDADGLTVRGVLRNPSGGTPVSHLSAVVLLFNHDGGLVGSGRAEVQSATLGPGGETTFVVTVSGASNVERYRVSFRTQDDIVPHVDLRS